MINDSKLSNKSSFTKLESQKQSIRKSMNEFSRMVILSSLSNDPWLTYKTKDKFLPKWKGPYVVEMVYSNGAYHLTNPNGNTLMMPVNGKFLKKYYP